MSTELLMGNQAMAMGAIHAGVQVVTGYPGTPSTEVLETIASRKVEGVYVEWSVNEKVALEVAAGASMAGKKTLVTMKQVGLNVASDPLMCLSYIGVKGGMVVLVADDPGPISSQTEQDTRQFGIYSKLPVFDPSSVEEAYEMMKDAYEYSEKYETPVILRPTTRICHGYASMEIKDDIIKHEGDGFKKDSRWVIFPKLSYEAHLKIESRNPIIANDFSNYRFNTIEGKGRLGIVSSGVSYAYTKEALSQLDVEYKMLKIATPHPFPEKLTLEFLKSVDQVLVLEELDPFIEKELTYISGKYKLNIDVRGKLSGDVKRAGENSCESNKEVLSKYFNLDYIKPIVHMDMPDLPTRPPVLCAGCPHRASFYAVKQAMKGKKAVFSGDIGCYTLGNAMPLDMVDTCLCMGAGITNSQGIHRAQPDTINFAFIGDSTFFHSGITGVINSVYNDTKMVLIVLDNSTTAMTGHQPHPGTGKTMMGNIADKISISAILKAIGVKDIQEINPLNLDEAKKAVTHAASVDGVSAIIYKSPCIYVTKSGPIQVVNSEKCTGCYKCIREIGCPALIKSNGKVKIDSALCFGCELCTKICPFHAIGGIKND
ncbi:indolepyruvate ferredoxin oxidoreductase subunit alpha [Tissierella creatinini]|nr:indolepyruvate ferredoxin oxidoreductase subunit alpha [Tissierella creatinini]TJX66642.1 indolepyruvate ferredoxin oxidoreductase subunit alpha [Soehngenia saccharolytica]